MNTELHALRHRISNSDYRLTEVRNELLEITEAMLKEKSVFNFEDDQPLATKDGEQFAVETVEKGDDNDSFVTGKNNDGREFYLLIDQIDTDSLTFILDRMCKELEKTEL